MASLGSMTSSTGGYRRGTQIDGKAVPRNRVQTKPIPTFMKVEIVEHHFNLYVIVRHCSKVA